MTKEIIENNKKARLLVGDGKSPNLFFLTLIYGFYVDENGEDKRSPGITRDNETILISKNFSKVKEAYNKFKLELSNNNPSQIIIEDRLTGEIRNKLLYVEIELVEDEIIDPEYK